MAIKIQYGRQYVALSRKSWYTIINEVKDRIII